MTKQLFWSHLVEIEEIELLIKNHKLKDKEKNKLMEVVYHTYHLKIIDTVLSNLPKEKHQTFLEKLASKAENSKLLDWLKDEMGDIEDKIKKLSKSVKKEIINELQLD